MTHGEHARGTRGRRARGSRRGRAYKRRAARAARGGATRCLPVAGTPGPGAQPLGPAAQSVRGPLPASPRWLCHFTSRDGDDGCECPEAQPRAGGPNGAVLGLGVGRFRRRNPDTHWLTLEKSSKTPGLFFGKRQPLRMEVRKTGENVHKELRTVPKRVKA